MGLRYSSVVDAPIREVFDWHARPGAISRLTAPWQPVRVVAEADSLRDGRAVLGLPGPLRWIAAHRPDGYDPPWQFVDELEAPAATVLPWRHTHTFAAEGERSTLVTDTVDTAVPAPLLRATFAYRHAQLAGDLASHARARAWRPDPVTVAVTGSSGLVGTAVCALLSTGGHQVIRLVRGEPRHDGERRWNPRQPSPGLLAGVDAVIHLAGAPIAGRFTAAHKAKVRDSRVGPTRALAEHAASVPGGPEVFVSASAVGCYGSDRGDEVLPEDADPGGGFLADVVTGWEAATAPAADAGIRCVQVRTGIVQSPAGGTLRLLYPLFAAGLGGTLGSGRQWQPWIGIDDLADVYLRAVLDAGLSGPVNAVAPHPVRNVDYTRILARVLRRPAVVPVPAAGPGLLLGGEGARELALANQRAVPARLVEAGHTFRHPDLEPALRHVLGRDQVVAST